jgi:thiamine biosynthesis lipoprotein
LAVATSGTYERGKHIYNPKTGKTAESDIASISIIGPNVYEADRFATAAFAMGREGINFIASLLGFEGMMIDNDGVATMTDGFEKYAIKT